MAGVKAMYQEHDGHVANVRTSAKLDKMVLDGLKNARKSSNDELSDIATQACDIFLQNSVVKKAQRGLKNAVKLVQAMSADTDF